MHLQHKAMLLPRRAVVAIVAAVSLAIGLAGCSHGSADTSWTRISSGRLTVDRPADWNTTMTVTKPWTVGFQPAAKSVNQIQVSGDFGAYGTAREATGILIGKAQVSLDGFTIVQTRDIKIPGATSAEVVRYTINDKNKQPVYGEWIVGAHFPYPESVAVSILSPTYNRDLEQHVISSMTLTPR